jgi:tRNA(adenine34) deaminase
VEKIDRCLIKTDQEWMQLALDQARLAAQAGEVPVGAILVKDNVLVAAGFNQPISSCDPTAHAEIVALRAAAQTLGNYRLPDTTLYVTIEPCAMCAGALVQSRVSRLVFGATDPKAGAVGSLYDLAREPRHNHRVEVVSGVLANESSQMLKEFFAGLRNRKTKSE